MSGYQSCACRDCFEIAIASEGEEDSALCSAREESGCDPHDGECCATHAYCNGDEDEETGCCSDCGEEF